MRWQAHFALIANTGATLVQLAPRRKVFKFELAAGACDYYVTGTLAGRSSNMELDSGAQHTIVSRAVLPKTLPTGGTVRLKGATGMQVAYH